MAVTELDLTCTNCGSRIEPGEHHRLTQGDHEQDELAHTRCIVSRSTPAEWNHDEQSMEIDDVCILMTVDAERDIPRWIIGAANAGQLRDGVVGHLDLMVDGSIQFRQPDQVETDSRLLPRGAP